MRGFSNSFFNQVIRDIIFKFHTDIINFSLCVILEILIIIQDVNF